MEKIIIGQDNGVTSYFTILYPDGRVVYLKTPVKKCLNYTKTKAFISRIDVPAYRELLKKHVVDTGLPCLMLIERPMVNPTRFKATVSAVRSLEAMIIVLEELDIPYQYIDSKQWQSELLPGELKGPETKTASLEVGKRLFPTVPFKGDADSALMAEWARRAKL